MCFIKWAHNRVHCGSWPPAEQIVSSQQVDCHLLQTLGIDIITPQFCDSCLFVGGEISHFEKIGYCFPKRVLAIFLWFTLSSAFKVICRLCCDLGKEGFFRVLMSGSSKEVYLGRKCRTKEPSCGKKKERKCVGACHIDKTVGTQPTLASKIT